MPDPVKHSQTVTEALQAIAVNGAALMSETDAEAFALKLREKYDDATICASFWRINRDGVEDSARAKNPAKAVCWWVRIAINAEVDARNFRAALNAA